ncbi:MAG: hypothetical protein IJJ43_06095 [Oscillospiraceae bacterium]|nr:hypothetical protein [Oscillospiraceae bacterium]
MNEHEELARAVAAVAGGAAEALRELSEAGRLAADSKTARELCGVLKDALALERELCGPENAAITVRFEGETEAAAE